ncbi:hypothetical protein CTAYLR_006335 [Chrysophaeum taylorii]|uniref:Major facilitator superfamily (MFS) profile domain-containing protein n=1 Tax=Chrysophaeum taylorii TaxID=2483200 RepID=A0AAD7UC17_9STRA|nr:hypothetical protein CTAYLR_006335 [Chrysophaeum taylorii]
MMLSRLRHRVVFVASRSQSYLAGLGVVTLSQSVMFSCYSGIVPLLATVSSSATGSGLALAAPSVARLCSNSVLGRCADQFGRVPVIVGGEVVAAAATAAAGCASSVYALVPARFAFGVGGSAFGVGTVAWLTDVTAAPGIRRHRGVIMGVMGAFSAGAWYAGPAVSGTLAAQIGPAAAFGGLGAAILACAGAGLALPEPPRAADPPEDARFRIGETQTALAVAHATLALNYAALIGIVPLRVATLDGPATGLFGLIAAVAVLASPISGLASDRLGRIPIVLPGLAACALGTAGLALAPDPLSFTAAALLRTAGLDLAAPAIVAATSDFAPSHARGQALAFTRNAADVTYISAAPLLGFLSDLSGPELPLITCALFTTAATLHLATARLDNYTAPSLSSKSPSSTNLD